MNAAPEKHGALSYPTPNGGFAWAGLRLSPAQLLGAGDSHPDRAEADRLTRLRSRERDWLADLCRPDGRHRFEVRYIKGAGSDLLTCTMICSVFAPDPQDAVTGSLALRERLAGLPAHVVAEPIEDARELRERMDPLSRRGFIAEIRKRLIWAPPRRADAAFRLGAAVLPWRESRRSWEPLWVELAACEHPTLISVCLEPVMMSPAWHWRIQALAEEHARLAKPGVPSPLHSIYIPPDPFSERAAPLFDEAAHRYVPQGGGAYRVRVTVAAEGPPPTGFVEHLATVVSAAGPEGAVAVEPGGHERETAWDALSFGDHRWLEGAHGQGAPPGHLEHAVRILCDLGDVTEAAGAFRLPFELPNRPALFDRPDRVVPAPRPADRPPTGSQARRPSGDRPRIPRDFPDLA